MNTIKDLLEFKLINLENFSISIYQLLAIILIFIIAKVFLILVKASINRFLDDEVQGHKENKRSLYKVIKYVVYTITFLTVLKSSGLDISFILASSTALFVGLGFGLQDAFKDMASGILMMIERNVRAGDIIEVNASEGPTVGQVEEINIRTSKIKTRDGITIIIPNSRFVNDSVINWTTSNMLTRFKVTVGVTYGTDTAKVKQVLLKVAEQNELIANDPEPVVNFTDFGDSSLDFTLYFWTDNLWRVERLKSDLRFEVDRMFAENKITIPFPQRDLHIVSDIRMKKE